MANYYNLTAWKHTGFDYYNRPYNREVLANSPFTDSDMYIQMAGITVKRDDMIGITYIDLQGSVKDLRGDQVNSPNITGSQGTGGPWYSWEEVDYIRLARTGYPDDEDFIDIDGYMSDPWNAPDNGHKQLRVAYYFVTGLTPLARNVTRMFLQIDPWLTLGGADDLIIESGYKVRGHISESEDASIYNLADEPIGLIGPLEVIDFAPIDSSYTDFGVNTGATLVGSSIDLIQFQESQSITALIASASDGSTLTVPQIQPVGAWTYIVMGMASELKAMGVDSGHDFGFGQYQLGLFDLTSSRVRYNISVLYSLGQLELQNSYKVPDYYLADDSWKDATGSIARIESASGIVSAPVSKDISGYPRKADYMYGQMVLLSVATGNMMSVDYAHLTDARVGWWACIAPGGTPFARFMGIADHPYLWDQAIAGMPWVQNAIVLEGASGSAWNTMMAGYNQANLQITRDQTESDLAFTTRGTTLSHQQTVVTGVTSVASGILGAISNPTKIAGEIASAANSGVNAYFNYQQTSLAQEQAEKNTEFKRQSQALKESEINAELAKANTSAPYTNFVPTISTAMFCPNTFAVYSVNTGSADRERLRNYFRKYGYSGQYKELSWDTIRVKQNVNYIQAEGVVLRHKYYSMRDVMPCCELLAQGVFLWNVRPDMSFFSNNPDA